MARSLPPRPVLHPIRPALVLMRALADFEPHNDSGRPLFDLAPLLAGRTAFDEDVCAIRFEITNLDDIAALAGPHAAREASDAIGRRLFDGIGPHRTRRMCERRFFLAVPLPLEAALELAKAIAEAITRPLVLGRHCIQVAIGTHVVAGKRSEMFPTLAEAA